MAFWHAARVARWKPDVSDLIALATLDGDEASDHLARVYEWRQSRRVTQGKALVGVGSAVVLAVIVPLVQQDPDRPLSVVALVVTLASAALLVVVGSLVFWSSSRIQREYIFAQSLLDELKQIRPFLKLYRRRR